MTTSDSRRSPIEMLAEDYSRRLQAGENPTIEEYALNYPSYAKGIRDLFPIIAVLEDSKPSRGSRSSVVPLQEPALPAETKFGDFVIQREIGRGGMGIVYSAHQRSLNRRVALKVLPANYLPSPKHVMRFKREAYSSAKLHHTNIAPVFGVGEKGGTHYYAMQYIDGYGMDAIIRSMLQLTVKQDEDPELLDHRMRAFEPEQTNSSTGIAQRLVASKVTTDQSQISSQDSGIQFSSSDSHPTIDVSSGNGSQMRFWRFFVNADGVRTESYYWRNIAGLGIQVAGALQHAHDMAIFHRDIKPSNLMIDFTGKVWVTDFGLARVAGDPNLTESHDTVGTLRYMAPEQFQGQFDVRTEIYNLGVTLYEIATLQPAVTEPEAPRLIQQAMTETPIPPRAINPNIPRDLESIILKSIAPDPSDRYQSASELADDLRRFSVGDVIQAGRKRPWAKVWRWAQRNKTVARLALTVLVLSITVAVVATLGYLHTNNAYTNATADRDAAQTREKALHSDIYRLSERVKQLEQTLQDKKIPLPP